jgi:cytoskeletal protein CcmA (bactofilin family)
MNLLSREDFEARYPTRTPTATELPFSHSTVVGGDLTVSSDLTLRGVIRGNVIVKGGVQLNFHGVINGSLTIEPGATAYVNGVIKRDLFLSGGAMLEGVVKGNVRPEQCGELHVSGVVKGRILE